jgi:hypothetical protein
MGIERFFGENYSIIFLILLNYKVTYEIQIPGSSFNLF